jgi:uncharacterized protein (DUF362 family)
LHYNSQTLILMERRKFIKAGVIAVGVSFIPLQDILAFKEKQKVYEIIGTPENAVLKIFAAFGGIKSLINKDISKATVLLKPNLCLPHKDSLATITSVAVIKAISEYLINEGVGRIIIADHTLQSADQFEQLDMVTFAKSNPKISIMLANEQRYYNQRQIDGQVLKSAETLKILEKVDYFINIPTAKHHQATQVSLSLKGLMGVIWDRQVFHTEIDLDQAIADLAKVIRPNLNIIDASRVLLNRGPVGPGPIDNSGKLFASTDMVAVDSIVASRYNFGGKSLSSKDIPHIWNAYKSGVGEIEQEKIDLISLVA